MGALLLTAGAPKKRFSLPNPTIVIHQPSVSGLSDRRPSIAIQAKEILRMRSVINRAHGRSQRSAARAVERDFIMSAQQAREYGLIAEIIQKHRYK